MNVHEIKQATGLAIPKELVDDFIKCNQPELFQILGESSKITQLLKNFLQNQNLCMWKFLPANLRPHYHRLFKDLGNSGRTWSNGKSVETLILSGDEIQPTRDVVMVVDRSDRLNFFNVSLGLRSRLKIRFSDKSLQLFYIYPEQRTICYLTDYRVLTVYSQWIEAPVIITSPDEIKTVCIHYFSCERAFHFRFVLQSLPDSCHVFYEPVRPQKDATDCLRRPDAGGRCFQIMMDQELEANRSSKSELFLQSWRHDDRFDLARMIVISASSYLRISKSDDATAESLRICLEAAKNWESLAEDDERMATIELVRLCKKLKWDTLSLINLIRFASS
jgi:hypothetical protein